MTMVPRVVLSRVKILSRVDVCLMESSGYACRCGERWDQDSQEEAFAKAWIFALYTA